MLLLVYIIQHLTSVQTTWLPIIEDRYRNHSTMTSSRVSQLSHFPCSTRYSEPHPPHPVNRTVHQLRPQDIEFVASLGDSITAGTGALASNLLEVLDENRGSTYFTGGDGDWRSCPSIYNFIKSYNYKVKGGASGSTRVFEIPFKRKGFGERGLNLSVSGAVAEDLPGMVRALVKKIQKFPGWWKKWKMVKITNILFCREMTKC